MKSVLVILIMLAAGGIGGCASVPMGSKEADQKAKQFKVPTGKSRIYVYRNENFGSAIKIKLKLDGRSMGQTAPDTFHVWDVSPGNHEIECRGESEDEITLTTEPNKLYFVWQEMKMGLVKAGCELHEVDEERGKEEVLDCDLARSGPMK